LRNEWITADEREAGPWGDFAVVGAGLPDALVVQDWSAEEWTRGCYAAHFPASVWTDYGSAFRAPCGRIHWAGTETSSEWHGYMEGALRSGSRAAEEMLRSDASNGAKGDQEL
jgi:monoamine oxidase